MTDRTRPSWLVYALGALCAGAIVAAVLVVGPPATSQATVTRTATVARGIVQSTVSGSGNLQASSQLNLGFKTSGTVTHIYVTQGQQVTQGQLLASLDPQTAEVTLEQAKANLQSAQANLTKAEETDGESSTGSGAGGASAAAYHGEADSRITDAAYSVPTSATDTVSATGTSTATTRSSTVPATRTPTATTPSSTVPATSTTPATMPTSTSTVTTPTNTTPGTTSPSSKTRTTSAPTSTSRGSGTTAERETNGKETGSGSVSAAKATVSTATREANLASAKAAVRSDTLTVQSDEQAVQDTNLYAPESGTIVSLTGQVGEVVSGGGTTRATSSASSSSGSDASGTGAGAAISRAAASVASSSTASSSSSSAFAVLSDLSSMQLVVSLSESEIGSVKVGQIATVTVEALDASKLAAHVSEVALLSSSSSGAVSYDVTFQLDQLAPGLRLGMSATAEVVIKQAEGINVPTSAISAGSVTVERGGKQVRQRVTAGLAGNTSTIVLSGLQAGETVVLPAANTTGSSATNIVSRIAGRLGGGGLGGGGLGGAGLGGGAFFRGGG
jgi:multidrug efflux pump subunit AcrA (membrane-fusion protein)